MTTTTTQNTATLKCPFRATIMTRAFACEHAESITRREGPDIACNSTSANALCVEFFTQLKTVALTELGYEDDLTSMPASVLQKIQYGGLLGLHSSFHETPVEAIDNIFALITSASQQYAGIENFPFIQCIDAIKSYQLKRRKGR